MPPPPPALPKACYSSREGRGGAWGAPPLFTLAGSSENLSVLNILVKWPNGASLREGGGLCASVVSPGAEQSGLGGRWLCAHFHFSCGEGVGG